MSNLPQDASQPRSGVRTLPKKENALAVLAQCQVGGVLEPVAFNEAEFWSLVRRLSGAQTKMRLGDSAFCRLHPGVGSPSSWRVLKLLAEEKQFDLSRWYARLKLECELLEKSGVRWMDTAAQLPDGEQSSRLECQELVAKLETWRKAQSLSQYQFLRDYRDYTGDAATWARLRKGKWQQVNLAKWLSRLRDLARLVSDR